MAVEMAVYMEVEMKDVEKEAGMAVVGMAVAGMEAAGMAAAGMAVAKAVVVMAAGAVVAKREAKVDWSEHPE